ncbi:MAG: restriction endonuclease subunit S [Thermodesulfobacteriota bacterium]
MSNLPNNWEDIGFGELNRFASKTIDPANSPEEEFELYSVPSFPTGIPEIQRGSAIGSTKQMVEPGDVLVCKINPRINRVWQVGPKKSRQQIASSEWIVLRAPDIDARFPRYFFSSPEFRELICQDVTGVGGSLTRAQPKRVATFRLPIPPLNEQQRIADKLDAVLAKVDACREHLDRVPAILKRFRQAVLAAATSGRLTEEWRRVGNSSAGAFEILEQISSERTLRSLPSSRREVRDEGIEMPTSELPEKWAWCRIGNIADVQLGGTPSRKEPEYWSGNIPWVSSGEVSNCRIVDTAEKITRIGLENSNAKIYPKGTVLIAMIGEGKTRGQSAILDVAATTNQNSAGLVFDVPLVEPEYIWFWALGEYEKNRDVGRGGNQPALNGAKVRALPLPLPPCEEQQEIVRRVEALFAFADRLETRYAAARAQVERLTPALLAKAFRGKLVEQDPNDEPASKLLERIQAARAAAPARTKTRWTRKTKICNESSIGEAP